MAISTVTNRVQYQGDGTSAIYSFPYRIDAQTDLFAFIYNSSGTQPALITPNVLNTDYVFSGTANNQGIYPNGGSIIYNSTPNAQSVVVMFRSSAVTNNFALTQGGQVPATALNNELDKITMLVQRLQDEVTRAVRLPDGGYFGSFDPTIPANVSQSANKRLIVNSSATGWTFDETLGAYVPNALVYATTNSSLSSLSQNADGLFLRSTGSSAPQWDKVNIGSSASITGKLAIINGGTGGTSFIQYGLIYASTPTVLDTVVSAASGAILTANGSSAPSFQAFSANNVNSGTIQVQFGGTGTNTLFNLGNIHFSGSAGVYSQSDKLNWNSAGSKFIVGSSAALGAMQLVGFAAVPLRTDASGNFVSGSTALGSEVSGTLPVGNGGTGTAANYIQYGVIYASSATQFATVPAAASGLVLTANGSSAPSFQSVSVTNGVANVSNTYNVTTSDRFILANSSNYQINLFGASNTGKEITVTKQQDTLGTLVPLVVTCSNGFVSAQNQAGSSVYLHLAGESVDLYADGANWQVRNRRIPNQWSGYTPVVSGFGSSTLHHARWRRQGDEIEIDVRFKSATLEAKFGTVALPGTLQAFISGSSYIGSGFICCGTMVPGGQAANNVYTVPLIFPTCTSILYGFSVATASTPELAPANGNSGAFANTDYHIRAWVPIRDWQG